MAAEIKLFILHVLMQRIHSKIIDNFSWQ